MRGGTSSLFFWKRTDGCDRHLLSAGAGGRLYPRRDGQTDKKLNFAPRSRKSTVRTIGVAFRFVDEMAAICSRNSDEVLLYYSKLN